MRPPHRQNRAEPPQARDEESFWSGTWAHIKPPAQVIVRETVIFILIILGLGLIFLVLQLLAREGYPAWRIAVFEKMDYLATLCILGIFLVSYIVQVAIIAGQTTKMVWELRK